MDGGIHYPGKFYLGHSKKIIVTVRKLVLCKSIRTVTKKGIGKSIGTVTEPRICKNIVTVKKIVLCKSIRTVTKRTMQMFWDSHNNSI